jgi:hypothetical protein
LAALAGAFRSWTIPQSSPERVEFIFEAGEATEPLIDLSKVKNRERSALLNEVFLNLVAIMNKSAGLFLTEPDVGQVLATSSNAH